MNKLKPILAQQFWILVIIAVILPIVGWYPSTSDMIAKFDARKSEIGKFFDKVPKDPLRPNENWTGPVLKANEAEAKSYEKTQNLLWTHQWDFVVKLGDQKLRLITWPDDIAKDIPTTYRGEIEYNQRTLYRDSYDDEILKTWEMIKPWESEVEGEKLVDCPLEVIHSERWKESLDPPSSERMWDSQEDIWLYRLLMYSIASLNESEGATNRNDAPIKRILKLDLRGGDKKRLAGAAPSTAPAPKPAPAGGQGGSAATIAVAVSAPPASASFNANDEFGPEEEAAAAAPGTAAAKPAAPTPQAAPSRSTPGGAAGITKKRRYIDIEKEFKTRGFYMEVEMDHRKLPEFLVALSNSPWPLCITRVQQIGLEQQDKDLLNAPGLNPPAPNRPGSNAPGLVIAPLPTRMGSNIGNFDNESDDDDGPRRRNRFGPGVNPVAPQAAAGSKALTVNPKSPWVAHVVLSGYIAIYLAPNEKSTTDTATEQPDEEQQGTEEGAEGSPEEMDEPAAGDEDAKMKPEAGEADAMPAETDDASMDPDATSPAAASPDMEVPDESGNGAAETRGDPANNRKPE